MGKGESDPLLPKMEVIKKLLDPIEIVFFVLFTVSLILYYIALVYVFHVLLYAFFSLFFSPSFSFCPSCFFVYLYVYRHDKRDDDKHELYTLIFVGSYAMQRIPIFVLSLVIVAHRNGNEGPTRQSKVYLFFAAVFHLVNQLPIFFLSQVLPGLFIFK